jgi:excisionase family DNA binding protein
MATNTEHAPNWMSLGEVSRALEVNEATLRQWADRGRLPVYRTPGGHRRFRRADVETLMQVSTSPTASSPDSESLVLRRIRRKLSQMDPAAQAWMAGFQAEGRDRMRLFGRRLLSLLLQDGLGGRGRRKGEALSESHMVGHEYGMEMADRGVSMSDSVQAFLFFRQAVVEAVQPDRLRQVIEISDRVLLGLVDAYGARMAAMNTHAKFVGEAPAVVGEDA